MGSRPLCIMTRRSRGVSFWESAELRSQVGPLGTCQRVGAQKLEYRVESYQDTNSPPRVPLSQFLRQAVQVIISLA